MTSQMVLAVTGGTGFVGQAVLDEAGRRGLQVRALTRRVQDERKGIKWVRGDLHDRDALVELMQNTHAVLHIAGAVNAPDLAGFQHGNVEGTHNVLEAMRAAGVKRIACVSSLSAREPGLSDYGHSKRMAEEKVQLSGLDWTLIRPPAIYGPRDTEILELFRAAKWGVVPMPPAGRASLIHVDDLARLLLDCVMDGDVWDQRILEPDDGRQDGWGHKELAHAIGIAVGRKVWAPAMPALLIKLGAKLDRLIRGANAKLTPDRARYMVHPDWVCSPDRRVPENAWKPRIETGAGLVETAVWYAKNGWI